MRGKACCLVLAAFSFSFPAHAEEASKPQAAPAKSEAAPAKSEAAPAKSEAAPAKSEPADGVRRDPQGLTGISPMWEAIVQGDSAVLARDYEAAILAYREAIIRSPQNALAHYRMGEAQLLKGDFKEAQAALEAASRFAGKDRGLAAKALFRLADLSERAKNWDQALARWNAYSELAKTAEGAKVYPASAEERRKRVSEWKQREADSAAVKARIEKRSNEADENAKKTPLSR